MAIKIEGAKKPSKSKRDPIFLDEKAMGTEPVWDTEKALTFTADEFDHYLRKSLRYYNYFYSPKDLKKYVVEWLRSTQGKDHTLDKHTIDTFAKARDTWVPLTVCSLVKASTQGMPLREREISYIVKAVVEVAEKSYDEPVEDIKDNNDTKAKKPEVKVITIQDRLAEIAKKHQAHFEELEDQVQQGNTVDPQAFQYLSAQNVPQAMLGKILSIFEHRRAELIEARAGTCEQLTEGYSHFKAADYKRYEAFYSALTEGFTQYGQVKKATKKASVRKPPQKEKVVRNLKYLKQETNLKLVSISPVDIIGAQTLWVYNVKNRKIGRYVADDFGALTVKGTTITGYSESKSTQKTLRKPDVQLKEFMATNKAGLRKYLETIKTTEIKLNGRINQDTVLLKVY